MAISSTFLTVASMAFTAFSTITQMSAARNEGDAAQAQANANARRMENEATRTEDVGAYDAARIRDDTEAQLARARAIRAGTGGDVNTGSALLVAEDIAEEGALQGLLAQNNAYVSSTAQRDQADLTRVGGQNAAIAGRTRAGNTLLAGGASIAKTGSSLDFNYKPKTKDPYSVGFT